MQRGTFALMPACVAEHVQQGHWTMLTEQGMQMQAAATTYNATI